MFSRERSVFVIICKKNCMPTKFVLIGGFKCKQVFTMKLYDPLQYCSFKIIINML